MVYETKFMKGEGMYSDHNIDLMSLSSFFGWIRPLKVPLKSNSVDAESRTFHFGLTSAPSSFERTAGLVGIFKVLTRRRWQFRKR